MADDAPIARIATNVDVIREKVLSLKGSTAKSVGKKLAGAALSQIPWAGSFIQAAIDYSDDRAQAQLNDLHRQWLEEMAKKFAELESAIIELLNKVGTLDEKTIERLESPEFLEIVGKGFREWDQTESQRKRDMIRAVLLNAAATKLCEDDRVKLFIDWISKYHETHFKILAIIHQNTGITRYGIWQKFDGRKVREDSAEAGLFRLLIDDLSQGRIVYQHREKTPEGEFLLKPKQPKRPRRNRNPQKPGVAKSSFDDEDEYELSALGEQFVLYAMTEVVRKIEGGEKVAPAKADDKSTPIPPATPNTEAEDDAGISYGSFDEIPASDYGPSPWESDEMR